MITHLENDFLYNPKGEHTFCHAPTIAELKNGDLLAAWYAYPEKETVSALLVIARKEKRSKEWSKAQYLSIQSKYSAGNPVLFQEPGGKVWLLFVTLQGPWWDSSLVNAIYSEDQGLNWTNAETIWQEKGVMIRHAPLFSEDGTILLPAYEEGTNTSIILKCEFPYRDWQVLYKFVGFPLIQPVLVRAGQNRIGIFFRPVEDPRFIWKSFSTNEGRNWSSPIRMAFENPLSGIAAFSVDDNVGLVFNPSQRERRPLSVSISYDKGGTDWSAPYVLDDSNLEVSYPAFIVGKKNRVHGVYTFNRKMIKYISFSLENNAKDI